MNLGIDIDDDTVQNIDVSKSSLNNNSNNSSSINNDSCNIIKLNIRHLEDPLLVVDISLNDRVDHLKSIILEKKQKKSHRIRLIYNGRMLIDDNTIQQAKLTNNCFIICSITPLNSEPTIAELPPNSPYANPTTTANNIGIPLSANNSLIADYQHILANNANTNYELNNNGTYRTNNDIILEMENFRMQQQNESMSLDDQEFMESSANIVRDSLELVFGMAFGFFFGPIALFWLSKDYLAKSIKFGIIIGVSFNVLIGLSSVAQ